MMRRDEKRTSPLWKAEKGGEMFGGGWESPAAQIKK